MDIFRTIASSFRAVNRMGNEHSSQRVPESSAEAPAAAEAFNPDEIQLSDEEEDTKSQIAPASPEPELPPAPPRESWKEERREKKREKKRKSKSALRSVSAEDEQRHEQHVPETTNQDEVSSEQEPNDANYEQNVDEGLLDDNILYPDISGEPEQDNYQDETQTEHQEQNERPEESRTRSSPLQLRPKLVKSRYICPLANRYDCDKTFASENSAKRHAKAHLPHEPFVCPVCAKNYSRGDKLKTHMLSHTRKEIESANLTKLAQRVSEQAIDQAASAVQTENRDDDGESAGDIDDHHVEPTSLNGLQETPGDAQFVSQGLSSNEERHDRPSTKPSTSSARIFDGMEDTERIQETPRPKSRLKRKRDMQSSGLLSGRVTEPSHKRRRRHSLSPPTSVASHEEASENDTLEDTSGQISASIAKVAKIRSAQLGNLDNFAKPWTPGSQLHHPIHNPRSPRVGSKQRVEILIPQTSHAGPSTEVKSRNHQVVQTRLRDDLDTEQTPLAGKSQKVVVTSPKGKRKAAAGVRYSSPSGNANEAVDDEGNSDASEPTGMATSIARRGTPTVAGKKRPRQVDHDDNEDNPIIAPTQSQQKSAEKPFGCQECGRKFLTKESLRKHEKRPNVHSDDHVCEDCSKAFPSIEKLRAHQQVSGHGDGTGEQGRKGAFSDREVKKLRDWREHFCEDNNINIPTFNQMMTDSCRRAKLSEWPYRFISKADFLREYYDVLPDRNRRSMHRYREREFQNVPEKQEWTEEDDEELMRLVKEIGQKWVEIGQRMTRTQDSVSQRWRFKLKYQGKAHQGEWVKSEEEKLKDVVAQVKRESGISFDVHADTRFPWDSVSKKMKGKRTPQQCSNKWRLMHLTRRGNIFIKPSESSQKLSMSPQTITPSKMSLRLAGQTPSSGPKTTSSKKRIISDERVHETDDDDDDDDDDNENDEDDTASNRKRTTPQLSQSNIAQNQDDNGSDSEPADIETPAPRRKPLLSKTPQTSKGLSQAFAQTQANTSALRAPNTIHKPHTQTEMPTPGIDIQRRPASSPWQAINSITPRSASRSQVDEDEIMAEPQSSDAETSSAKSIQSVASGGKSSETTSAEGSEAEGDQNEDEDEESNDPNDEVASRSNSGDPSDSQSSESSDSEAEASIDEADLKNAQRNLFLQSLQSPAHLPSSNFKPGTRNRPGRIDLAGVYRGDAVATQDESDSDSADEGDIMHH